MGNKHVVCLILLSILNGYSLYAKPLRSFDIEFYNYSQDFNLSKWIKQELGENLEINTNEMRQSREALSKENGWEHIQYSPYYKGVPIEYSSINIHMKDGYVYSINGNYFPDIDIAVSPIISKECALAKAMEYAGAIRYSWQESHSSLMGFDDNRKFSRKPEPKLVICPNILARTMEPTLAYKVDLFSTTPFCHQYVYISAIDSSVIYAHKLTKSVVGKAQTRYSGLRFISTTLYSEGYTLIDATRGDSIKTCSYDCQGNYFFLKDIDNIWKSTEYHNYCKYDAALDVHWGAMMTYDYFYEKFGRNGIDGNGLQIKNFVNTPDVWANAFWDTECKSVFYGWGDDYIYDAFVSLDVVAHELGHGITDSYNPSMIYAGESGAINESLSDIWAACVENYAAPEKQHWRMGEDLTNTNHLIRYFDNPWLGHQPKAYMGTYFLHQGVDSEDSIVHLNSGVSNHWFYLLSDGGAGINEFNYSYEVEGIGINTAANIVYESLNYLQDNMTFMEYAAQTQKAAIRLFGLCAPEVRNVTEAWRAVGVPVNDIPDTLNTFVTINYPLSNRYYATSLIKATNIVRRGASAHYESANKIEFLPGFMAEWGANVVARIAECEPFDSPQPIMRAPVVTPFHEQSMREQHSNIRITPNPVVEVLNLEGVSDEKASFIIYDAMGKMVKIGTIFATHQINVANLCPGAYIIRLCNCGSFEYIKFIKE